MISTIQSIYLARTNNENQWKDSSSGGAFWNFVINIIENKGGVCYGARYTNNFDVIHDRAETVEEARVFMGSKYLQSDMAGCYKMLLQDLKSGRYVLFSGTPCQIQAVKKFVPSTLQDRLILIEILCHGVPSPKIFQDYIKLQEERFYSKVAAVSFRGKKLRGSIQDMYIKFASGKEYKSFGTHDIYYKLFSHELVSRECCIECKFANMNRNSDITISDFWGNEKNIPAVFDGKIGLSCIYIITDKGEKFWDESKGGLIVEPSSIEVCDQPTLHHPIGAAAYKEMFWKKYLQDGLLPAFEYYFGNYNKMCFMRAVKNFMNETGLLKIVRKIKG